MSIMNETENPMTSLAVAIDLNKTLLNVKVLSVSGNCSGIIPDSVSLGSFQNDYNKNEPFSRMGRSDVFNYFVWPTLMGISLFGATCNLIIFGIICFSSTFRRPVNYFIGNLAIVSTLFVISVVLRFEEDRHSVWDYTDTLCKVLPTLHRFPITLEAFSVMMISLDRSKVVRHPLSLERKLPALRKIGFSWFFALILELPRGLLHQFDPNVTAPYKCVKATLVNSVPVHVSYAVLYLLAVYILPAIVMIRELSKLQTHLKYLSLCKNAPNASKGIRLVKNAYILTLIFMIFHIPIGVLYFPMAVPRQILPESISSSIPLYREGLYIITYLHGAVYSIFIFVTSNELRSHLRLWCHCWPVRNQPTRISHI